MCNLRVTFRSVRECETLDINYLFSSLQVFIDIHEEQ